MPSTETLLKQVKASIGHASRFDSKLWPIGVEFADGTLRLAGDLPEIGAKKTALRAAAAVDGVHRVVDGLRVGHPEVNGDGALRDAICTRLLHAIDFRNCAIHAVVKGRRETLRMAGSDASGSIEVQVAEGVVTLSGDVISLSHRRLAGVLAWWAVGCRDVLNELAVVPHEDDNDDELADALRLVLETDPYVHADGVAIAVREGVVTLSGLVPGTAERSRAEMDAWCVDGVELVINRLQVR